MKKRRPASSPEIREKQLIDLAVNLAEKQLQEGTASAQVITHYLKLGSTREKLEKEKLQAENEMLKAKTKSLEAMDNMEKVAREAIEAMKSYSGTANFNNEELS